MNKSLKNYNVVRSKLGNYLVRQIGQGLETDTHIGGPFTYNAACKLRDKERFKGTNRILDKKPNLLDLSLLILQLDNFTQSEIEKVLRGDANIGLRRKAKNLSVKLAAASIKTGMEAAAFKPVPTKKESV